MGGGQGVGGNSVVMVYGDIEAYTEPSPGVRRPLRIIASAGTVPVVDADLIAMVAASRAHDPLNSTTTTVGAGAEWVGEWVSSDGYAMSITSVLTDQDSADGGLSIDSSNDGIQVDHTHYFSVLANTPAGIHVESAITGQYYRVRYKAGTVAPSTLRISSSLSRLIGTIQEHGITSDIYDSRPANLVRAVLSGRAASGAYVNITASPEGSLYIHHDPHLYPEISVQLTRATGVTDTLAVAAAQGDRTITVTNGAQWSIPSGGRRLRMVDDNNPEYDTLRIISAPVGNVLTLDRPLDVGHAIGTQIIDVDINMAVDGSATAQLFTYAPRAGQRVHIHQVTIWITSSTEPALYKFGGISELVRGLHFYRRATVGRNDTYWIPFRTNAVARLSGFSYEKEAKVGTLWAMVLEIDLDEVADAVVWMDGALGHEFVAAVQDDLTGLSSLRVKLQIHEEPK